MKTIDVVKDERDADDDGCSAHGGIVGKKALPLQEIAATGAAATLGRSDETPLPAAG